MGFLSIMGIILKLPSIIGLLFDILKLIKEFKSGGFSGIEGIAGEILQKIIGLIGIDNARAKVSASELRTELKKCKRAKQMGKVKVSDKPSGLENLLGRLKDR